MSLSLRPKQVRRITKGYEAWWYEEPRGIALYVQAPGQHGPAVVHIPLHQLRAYLARVDAEDRPHG